MAVTGAIFSKKCQCNHPTQTNEKVLYHATPVGNKREKIEDKKIFFIFNIVSIVSSPSKKAYENEVNAIKDLIQCIM